MEDAPAQRLHRRWVRGHVGKDKISADILVEQGIQITKQDIEFDPHRDLAVSGWKIERQRLVCRQDLTPRSRHDLAPALRARGVACRTLDAETLADERNFAEPNRYVT